MNKSEESDGSELIQPAFPEEEINPEIDRDEVHEHLRKVREESNKIGNFVFSSKIIPQDTKIRKIKCSESRKFYEENGISQFKKEWVDLCITRFKQIKLKLEDKKLQYVDSPLKRLDNISEIIFNNSGKNDLDIITPNLDIILNISEVSAALWINQFSEILKSETFKENPTISIFKWIFAMLLILELPIDEDVASDLNKLESILIKLKKQNFMEAEISTLVVIIYKYFKGKK